MTAKTDKQDTEEPLAHITDPIATILFVIFVGSLGYLLTASMVGLYPWMPVMNAVWFIPTWDAAITVLSLLTIMFLSLIGGLVKMRYSIILVGIVLLVAVFIITFFTMFFFTFLSAPML